MEENEMTPNAPITDVSKPIEIDATAKMFLTEAAKWGKFLSIVGFVFCGIIAVAAIFIMFAGGSLGSRMGGGMGALLGGFAAGFLGFIYLLMGLLYYFPSKYLYDFTVYCKQAIALNDQESMNYAFERLKSLFKFWGILMIVILAFYALILLFAVLIGGFAASQLHGV